VTRKQTVGILIFDDVEVLDETARYIDYPRARHAAV